MSLARAKKDLRHVAIFYGHWSKFWTMTNVSLKVALNHPAIRRSASWQKRMTSPDRFELLHSSIPRTRLKQVLWRELLALGYPRHSHVLVAPTHRLL